MNRQNGFCCENGHTPGIVSANVQQIGNIYPPQHAIRYGTVFPELNKPMACAASPSGSAQPTTCQTAAFSAWDVRLYLNTHPNDMAALQLYQQMCQQAPQPNYACTFAPCTHAGRWAWLDDPWPWEYAANGRRG